MADQTQLRIQGKLRQRLGKMNRHAQKITALTTTLLSKDKISVSEIKNKLSYLKDWGLACSEIDDCYIESDGTYSDAIDN